MVTLEEVATLVRGAVRGRKRRDAVLDESTRIQDLDLSSLQLAEIVFTLEEEKGVRFDGSRVSEVATLGELVELANESLGQVSAVGGGE